MNISVNGEMRNIPEEMGVDQLLEYLGYQPGAVAVAVNLEFVPRSAYTNTRLRESDKVEILSPISGG
jgi:sulfur carrier protein